MHCSSPEVSSRIYAKSNVIAVLNTGYAYAHVPTEAEARV